MSIPGKQISIEMEEVIVRLKQHFDQERKESKVVATKDSSGRVAKALDIGVSTVKRTIARYNKNGGKIIPKIAQRPGRPPGSFYINLLPIVRQHIRKANLDGKRISIDKLRWILEAEQGFKVPKTSIWRALSRWGFTHGEGRRRDSLKEQDYVILARRNYLRHKLSNRNKNGTLKRPEVYLDETYINKNYSNRFTWYLDEDGPWVNKPSGVGPRLIVLHAITKDGWIDGAQLVFEAKKRTGDYHGQMNWDNFSKWYLTQLQPNLPNNALIILDNAQYHNMLTENCFPGKSATKEKLKKWLSHNNIPWREDMLKAELLELCLRLSPKPEYRLDQIAEQYGHSILRTPPYHPELQPIETCWAIVKNYMADNCDFTLKGLWANLPDAFEKVTAETSRGLIQKVAKREIAYWDEDKKIDEQHSENHEECQDAENGEGLEHYLEEV